MKLFNLKIFFSIFLVITMVIQPAIMPAVAAAEAIFEDDFKYGDLYWDTTNMSVADGILADCNSESISGAVLKGDSDCGWKNMKLDIKLAIGEEAGWVMIKVRDTETFLVRRSGIWHYGTNLETNKYGENQLCIYETDKHLTKDKYYTYHIEAIDDTISISVLDGGTVVGEGTFKTQKIEKGKISFAACDDELKIDSVKVTDLDDEILNENYIEAETGSAKVLSASKNVTWTSSDETVAMVDASGKMTALSKGGAVITAAASDGSTDSMYVAVYETENYDFIQGASEWKLEGMQARDDILVSDCDTGFSVVSMQGNSDSGMKNFIADIKMSVRDGWTQISVRDTEIFLLRRWGIWQYKGGEKPLSYFSHIDADKFYTYHIEAFGSTISLTILDGEKVISSGSFETEKIEKGKIKITSYENFIRIKSVKIRSLDTDDLLEKNNLKLKKDETEQLIASENVTWSSSNEAVATVDSNGNVAAVASGNAIITAAASDGTTDSVSVTVWQKPTSLVIANEVTTLQKGESIGVNVLRVAPSGADTYLKWYSSNEDVLQIVGNTHMRKSLKAVNEGSAKFIIKNCDNEVLFENVVTVVPERDKYTQVAYASFGSEKTAIKPLLYGIHIPDTTILSADAQSTLYDMNFRITRSYQMDPQNDGIYDLANAENIPQMIGLKVTHKSVDELVEDLKAIHESLNDNSTIYVELGNELYDPTYLFDQNGDGKTDATDYVTLCRPVYTALKNYAQENGFEVKVGAVLLGKELSSVPGRLGTWDSTIKANPDFYDAVILHQYTTFNSVDGYTDDEAMKYMYGTNKAFAEENKLTLEECPGKELWITEYGTLLQDCFNQSFTSERARLQFANTVGMSLINAEKLLNMAADGTVKMSSYHCFEDSQGFGLVSSGTFLPEYYTFKKIGDLINSCSYAYPESEVNAKTAKYKTKEYKEIGVWGFGDENDIEYAVIANRSKNPTEFTLTGYSLTSEWSYGSDNILEGFLEEKRNMYVFPTIPEPKIIDSNAEDSVILDGYSLTVCKLTKNDSVNGAYISISDKEFNPLTDVLEYACDSEVKMYKNDTEIQITESGSGTIKTIVPAEGFKYDTEYKLIANGTERSFKTSAKPPFEKYETAFEEDFSCLSMSNLKDDWTYASDYWRIYLFNKVYRYNIFGGGYLETKQTYEDFALTFDIERGESDREYVELRFRGGFLRFDLDNTGVRSYFNGKNGIQIGNHPSYSVTMNVKVVAYKEFVYVWCAADGGAYEYIGRVENVPLGATTISFTGGGTYYLDNVVIKSGNNVLNDVAFYAVSNGDELETAVPSIGENRVSLDIMADYTNAFYAAAVYNDKGLKQISEFKDGNAQINMEKGDVLKIFVWDSVNAIAPLQETFSPAASDFVER